MNGTFVTLCALPDAMLAHLIRPTGAERRSDKAFTPHPTLMARFTRAHRIWCLLALFRRLNIQHFQRQRCRCQSSDFRLIVCRSHFHYVHPNNVEIFQAAYQFNSAIGGQAGKLQSVYGEGCERLCNG